MNTMIERKSSSDTEFATPYRVSTITCNGSIGKKVEEVYLDTLFRDLDVIPMESDDVGFIYMIDREGKDTKGVSPKKEKRSHTKKNKTEEEEVTKKRRFDNAISGYFQTQKGYYPSVKIFKNGTIQMTGLKKIEDGEVLNQQVFQVLESLIRKNPTIVKNPSSMECSDFYVRLINSDFAVPFHIRRKDLHHLLISDVYNNTSSFQPGTYPGVKLQYFWNPSMGKTNGICSCKKKCFGKGNGSSEGECKKITISIFESGKILITGAINFAQINEAYHYICGVLQKHQHTLQKVVRNMD